MPSQLHALLVDLFRSAPTLARELVRVFGGAEMEEALSASTSVCKLLDPTFPVPSPDYHVDVAVGLEFDPDSAPELVVLVEVQLDVDPDKWRSWPLYQAAARARYKCDACVLVIALEERVAAWARDPVRLGPGGSVFRAIVLGPSVTDAHPSPPESAPPEIAILWAAWCGKRDRSVVASALEAIERLDEDSVAAYLDLLRYTLTDEVVEAVMATSENKWLSDYARRIYSESEAKGRAEGKVEGKVEGKAEGKAEGVRSSLLSVLSVRGLVPDASERARIEACDDVVTLDGWLRRAATADKVEAVFSE